MMPIAASSVVDYISGHYARLRFIVVGICQQEFYFGKRSGTEAPPNCRPDRLRVFDNTSGGISLARLRNANDVPCFRVCGRLIRKAAQAAKLKTTSRKS